MTASLEIGDVRFADGTRADVAIHDGLVSAIGPVGTLRRPVDARIDGAGRLLTPTLVNGHAHLDKTFMGAQWQPHVAGSTVRERVVAERALRSGIDVPLAERARTLATAMAAHGVGAVRTHVDIDAELGIDALLQILELRSELADLIDMQIVAFPQSGILHEGGVAELLADSLAAGADAVGGLDPAGFDGDADAHLDTVFTLAGRHDAGVDIHLHDQGELGLAQLADIARRTDAADLRGRVIVSHAYALGSAPLARVQAVGDLLAASGVAIMTNGPVGMTPPVLELRRRGVVVFSGSDNIRDAWWPYGSPDILETARNVAYQSDFRTDIELDVAFDLVTDAARHALGFGDRSLRVGAPADLVLFDAESTAEAVACPPRRLLVLKSGRIVAASPDLRRSSPVVHHLTTTSSTNL